ncbi:MAG: sugar phosphate isomerase/epimerase [Chloroflexi bacterium]|nr:sugar phosphate isomerase/epimerase [Chloroflexota bacterium]
MFIVAATANYYQLPFERALSVIAGAGMQEAEMALYWRGGDWAMAQHLEGYSPRAIASALNTAGIQLACVHDGGGVLDRPDRIDGYINPSLAPLLDALGYAPAYIVLHTPHVRGEQPPGWWDAIAGEVAMAAHALEAGGAQVTIENTPPFEGFAVPLTLPEQLADFTAVHGLGITLDTSHYAQMGIALNDAAEILGGRIRSVHLSDYTPGAPHSFLGYGELDLKGLLGQLASPNLVVTIEASPVPPGVDLLTLPDAALSAHLAEARDLVAGWISENQA